MIVENGRVHEVAVQNPFPGLRPFEARDSTLFFGRDDQIGEALDRLLRQRLLAVVGVSGCGKSSLVGAGMIPALEMGLAGNPEQRWRIATMRPGDGPLRELARCLGFGGGALAERTYGLLEAVETHLPPGENLLLVVDQFEEIFAFRDRKLREGAGSEADLFVSYLLRAAQDPLGRVYVLLTMRSDYLGECAKFHGLPEALNDGQYLVPRMTRQQLQEAIEGPLGAAGVDINPGVVQELLNRCDEEPDSLPLLQHFLWRVFEQWELDGAQGSITAKTAGEIGGFAEALDRDAERVYGGLTDDERRIAKLLFRRITEFRQTDRGDNEDRPIRCPQTAEHLVRLIAVSEEALRSVAGRFESRGLLVIRGTDQGDKVDLPHECLCLSWQRLKKWIRIEGEDAKNLRFILDSVNNKSHLSGLALTEALAWQEEGRFTTAWPSRYLTAEQIAAVTGWIVESQRRVDEAAEKERLREEEKRREAEARTRRAILTSTVLAIAFLIAATTGIYAYLQKGEAEKQKAEADKQRTAAISRGNEAELQRNEADKERNEAQRQTTLAQNQRDLLRQANRTTAAALEEAKNQAALVRLTNASMLNAGSPDLAALLGLEARTAAPNSFEAMNAVYRSVLPHLNLLSVLYRGSGAVRAVAFSPDGSVLATGGEEPGIRLWDVAARRETAQQPPTDEKIVRIAFGPDRAEGRMFVSVSDKGVARLWNIDKAGQISAKIDFPGTVAAIGPDAKSLASLDGEGKITLVDTETAKGTQMTDGVGDSTTSIAFNPAGTLLIAGNNQGILRLWDLSRRQLRSSVETGTISQSVRFSPDGKTVASAGADGTIRLIDIDKGVVAALTGHSGAIREVAFSRDGSMLASAGADGTVRLWSVTSRRSLGPPIGVHSGEVMSVAFGPDGKVLATGGADQTLALWDMERYLPLGQHENEIRSVAVSPAGMVASAARDVRIWDPSRRGVTLAILKTAALAAGLAFSPDGALLASAGADKSLQLWDMRSGRTLGKPLLSPDDIAGLRRSSLVRPAAFGVRSVPLATFDFTAVTFSPEGRLLAATGGGAVRIWDVATRKPLLAFASGPRRLLGVAFSPDGKLVATAGDDGNLSIWESDTGRQSGDRLRSGAKQLNWVQFSPNGKTLAAPGSNGSIYFWDVVTRKLVAVLRKGQAAVRSISFSPGGSLLASADEAGTIRLWDLSRMEQLGDDLQGHSGVIWSIAFSRNGKKLITGGADGSVRSWDVDASRFTERLCDIASRNFYAEEWTRFFGAGTPYRSTCPSLPPGGPEPADRYRIGGVIH